MNGLMNRTGLDLSAFRPQKILVCQLRQIGDVVLSTPALELLRKRFPDAELHMVTEQKCAPLLYGNPNLDILWELDKKQLSTFAREFSWYWKVARQDFDLVIDFQQLPRCRWIVGLSGGKVRLSFMPPWYHRPFYNLGVTPSGTYSSQTKVSLLAPLGIEWHGEPPRIYLQEEERQAVRERLKAAGLKEGETLVTLAPTHKDPARRWPSGSFAELARLLLSACPAARFLPLWGPGEERTVQDMLQAMTPETRAATILLEDNPDLRRSAALIEAASLHVGNCSAPRHVAVAVGTPSCTVLGASNDSWTFPSEKHCAVRLGLPCQPCRGDSCADFRCLSGLEPKRVAEAALPLMRLCPQVC